MIARLIRRLRRRFLRRAIADAEEAKRRLPASWWDAAELEDDLQDLRRRLREVEAALEPARSVASVDGRDASPSSPRRVAPSTRDDSSSIPPAGR